jgi:hypothetical protein
MNKPTDKPTTHGQTVPSAPIYKVSVYWPAVFKFLFGSALRIFSFGFTVLLALGIFVSSFNWLSLMWGRGGPSETPPKFPFVDVFTKYPYGDFPESSFPTYWSSRFGLLTPTFHTSKSDNLLLRCQLSTSKAQSRLPARSGDFFGEYNLISAIQPSDERSDRYVNINLKENKYTISTVPTFLNSTKRPNSDGSNYLSIEAGSDRYYCLDMAKQPEFTSQRPKGAFNQPLYYCVSGFDPATNEFREIALGAPADPSSDDGTRPASVTVRAGVCVPTTQEKQ